jgi:hypothetical protein
MIEAIDSYYSYIAAQMKLVDSTQLMGGIVAARDWPQTPTTEGALYLVYMQSLPKGGTESQVFYEYFCQWIWLLMGTNIAATQTAANRGDRYRKEMSIEKNLRQAHFASYCPKLTHALSGSLIITGGIGDGESVWWSHLRFGPKMDVASGVIYGSAAVQLYAYDDVLPQLA